MTNYADAEGRADWLANRPDRDLPDLADVIEPGYTYTPDPNTRRCNGQWGVRHDRDQWLACPFCGGAS